MPQKPIREVHGKQILSRLLPKNFTPPPSVLITSTSTESELIQQHPWLTQTALVVKPDQLIKRRGKSGLLLINTDWKKAWNWIQEKLGKNISVEGVTGEVTHFIVESFVPHEQSDEYYVCIQSLRDGDEILFHHEGGVEIGDVDSKAKRMLIAVDEHDFSEDLIITTLLSQVPQGRQALLAAFIKNLFLHVYWEANFAYLEINPLVVVNNAVIPLDMAAKIDQCADFECASLWGDIDFPAPFGRPPAPEEKYIAELDSKTGASLKLTILNASGRVWLMVAGGGASVVYADTIADFGFGSELANYGEYSGDPSEAFTFEYAKTVLDLMTRGTPSPAGKVLICGGGIANFTNVAETFKGVARAITLLQSKLREHNVKIFVRRGGPNYEQGLQTMRDLGASLGLPISVYGPETHVTAVIAYALGKSEPPSPHATKGVDDVRERSDSAASLGSVRGDPSEPTAAATSTAPLREMSHPDLTQLHIQPAYKLFSEQTRCVVYGMQPRAVQGMLDFDYTCGRSTPSVAAVIYPFAGNHFQKFYWGTTERLMQVYSTIQEACTADASIDTLVNFSSFRSVYSTMQEVFAVPQIRTVAIIAEGVPENKTRLIIRQAKKNGVSIIGPATVGGIRAGAFRIGNTGGAMDNILASRLYRAGSVGFVSRSGGMSNELNNIIARNSDGTCEGVAIGGDKFVGTTFIDHLLRYEADPNIKMLVLLGEVGGKDEYDVIDAIKSKRLTKPLVAWCIGTCAKIFPYEVQFGHAGALAGASAETAEAKNLALKAAGARVPPNFNEFGEYIRALYEELVAAGTIVVRPEPEVPKVPVDYAWALKLGMVRKPAAFVSTICDDRGEELLYAGMTISDVFKDDIGIGGVLSLLWFGRRLPPYACKFIEIILMLTADHGPAVSGAHNTIVTARAGKDLISALCSGLLTIGPRFGGAVDGAATQFSDALDRGLSPKAFVAEMSKKKELIMGIGHRVKSASNPDMRVSILKEFVKSSFTETPVLDFALGVEKITTTKKENLILNVDGTIGVCFVDLLRTCGAFNPAEADEYLKMGILNGLFVLGRSIGFIGHFIDQKRMKQGLYRHPTDDITYLPKEDRSVVYPSMT